MKIIVLSIAILLAGCTTVPVTYKFPEAPPILLKPCPDLETIEKDKVLLSELMKTVTRNYTKYHECRDIVKAWQDWYIEQQKISKEANSKN